MSDFVSLNILIALPPALKEACGINPPEDYMNIITPDREYQCRLYR